MSVQNRTFIVTGANGHLGSALIRLLKSRREEVRGLVLPGETVADGPLVRYFQGDVTKKESLRPLFEKNGGKELYVVHAAGIVDISGDVSEKLWQVNVGGTRNILDLCREYSVKRLVYISSVHAIPEQKGPLVQREVREFSPGSVVGGYAKTKAEATREVLDAAAAGLDAVVVHPSGILGPYDSAGNHIVQLVADYIRGKLPACVKGGYDFVDVRDVAKGCLLAARKGKAGECYILSNGRYEIRELLKMIRQFYGGRRLCTLPAWAARAALPGLKLYARAKKQRPLYTRYSLYTLGSNSRFSHDKATAELGYRPREMSATMKDTVNWLLSHPRPVSPSGKKRLRTRRIGMACEGGSPD